MYFNFGEKYKVPELKSDIREALKFGNVKFARRTLAIALNTIGKTSSKNAGRRRRSYRHRHTDGQSNRYGNHQV